MRSFPKRCSQFIPLLAGAAVCSAGNEGVFHQAGAQGCVGREKLTCCNSVFCSACLGIGNHLSMTFDCQTMLIITLMKPPQIFTLIFFFFFLRKEQFCDGTANNCDWGWRSV